jgi:hypothetical protein
MRARIRKKELKSAVDFACGEIDDVMNDKMCPTHAWFHFARSASESALA